MSTENGKVASATADEAIDWYLRNRAQELDAAQRQEFAAWLRASPLNVREYLAVAALSKDMSAAADTELADLEELIGEARAEANGRIVKLAGSKPQRSRKPFYFAAAAALTLLAVGGMVFLWPALDARMGGNRHLTTERGEQRTVRLSDGTLMHLNSDSHATVRYSDAERIIDVDRGQLMFEVARDTARPFRVRAGATQVIAIGTKFDVYRKPDAVTVTVIEGRVAVREEKRVRQPIELGAGEQLQLSVGAQPVAANPGAASVKEVDVQTVTAWLQGDIRFFRKPLGEVTEEFNRYNPVPIEIDDPALRGLQVSGIFNAYDIDSFLEFVRRLDGVEVRMDRSRIRVIPVSLPPWPRS